MACTHHVGSNRVVIIQPFSDFPRQEVSAVYQSVKKMCSRVYIRTAISLPANAYYAPRNRYRADSLIRFLNHMGSDDTVIIGLTSRDISTSNGRIPDWGIMGLGFTPGNAAVISSYRLDPAKILRQLPKVVIHELGHTQGLPHCPVKSCYMRDAAGGNHLDEETGFCDKCEAFLLRNGWMQAHPGQ